MQGNDVADRSRGIKSVEIGYQVLLAIQRGPGSVQLAEVARRTGLSSGAAHNYVASLIRTGLVEQESRGRYRLGPSAFALSLASFHLLDGYDVLRGEARTLQTITGANVAVAVWSQGGPVSVFTQRGETSGSFEFRSGLIPMLRSAAGRLCAAYLPDAATTALIAQDRTEDGAAVSPAAFIAEARATTLRCGYALLRRERPPEIAIAAPVWTRDDQMAFILSVIVAGPDDAVQGAALRELLDTAARASMLISATTASGPHSPFRLGYQASAAVDNINDS